MKKIALLCGLVMAILTLKPQSAKAQFCIPTFTTGCVNGDSIYYFQLGPYWDSTGCKSTTYKKKVYPGYDSIGAVIPLYRGKRYGIRALVTNSSQNFAVWLDYNNNGTFDTAEAVITDNNGSDSLNNYVEIPYNAKPGKIAFRIIDAYSTSVNFINAGMACSSAYTAGSAQDYIVDIKATKTDAAVFTVLSPVGVCTGTKQPIKVVIRNAGRDSIQHFPVAFTINGKTFTDTVKIKLGMDQMDTLTFDSSVTINSAGAYTYKAYTMLPGDSDMTNDTVTSSVTIAVVPKTPTGAGAALCKSGTAVISASSSTPGTKTSWFASSTSDTLLATTDTFTTPKVTTPTTYYAESQTYFADSISTDTPTYGTVRSNWGCMFDIHAKSNLYVDSFYVKTLSSGKARVEIYYKLGTFVGHETKSKDWTFVGFDTVAGIGTTIVPCYIHIPKVLQAGQTYGMYIRTTTNNTNYDVGSKVFTKKDMVITTGSSISGLFGTPQNAGQSIVTTRNWNGNVFYHLATCPSNRTAVSVTFSSLIAGYTYKNSCSGTQFTDTSKAGSGAAVKTWYWDFGDSTTSTTQNPIHNYKYGGSKSVKLIVGLGGGCLDSVTKTISVNASPKARFTYADTCLGDSVRFTNTSLPSGATLTYSWDFGDKSTASTATNPKHEYASAGSYSVVLISTYAGCSDTSKAVKITISPLPTVKFGYTVTCNSKNVKFSDSSFTLGGGNYSWAFGDTSSTSSATSPSHTYNSFNSYKATLTITAKTSGCSASLSHTVNFFTGSKAEFSIFKDSVCSGNGTVFTNTNVSKGAKYAWDFGDGSKVAAKDTTHTYAKGGTYSVKLIAMNSNGCNDTITKNVYIRQTPNSTFTITKLGFQHYQFVPADSVDLGVFSWNFGDSTKVNTVNKNPTHTYKGNILHRITLQATSVNGCSSSSTDSTGINTGIFESPSEQNVVKVSPNPFRDNTIISYNLESSSYVRLEIFDMTGRSIVVLANSREIQGSHSVIFDPAVNKVQAGVYLLHITIGDAVQSKQLIYVK